MVIFVVLTIFFVAAVAVPFVKSVAIVVALALESVAIQVLLDVVVFLTMLVINHETYKKH